MQPTITTDINRRAYESKGEYGELISSWEFPDRVQALAVEMVVLQDTLSHYKKPAKLRKNYWEGITEVRKIDEQEAVDYVQSVVDEMTAVGPLAFLHSRLVMSDEERSELEALMRDAPDSN